MRKKILALITGLFVVAVSQASPLVSFDMGSNTITKIREAKLKGSDIIIAGAYDGNVIALDYKGKTLWECKTGNGTIIHDLWCGDITGDKSDEVLVANGDGHIYCISSKGSIMWSFAPSTSIQLTPMYAVCIVKDKEKKPYIVCGNFDNSCYYLNPKGEMVMELKSKDYSSITGWSTHKSTPPPARLHYANFLRPIPLPDGSDLLAMVATNNHMQNRGELYLLEPLKNKLYTKAMPIKPGLSDMVGFMQIIDANSDGIYEVWMGSSSNSSFLVTTFGDTTYKSFKQAYNTFSRKSIGTVSYRVSQPTPIYDGKGNFTPALFAADKVFLQDKNNITKYPHDKYSERLSCNYTFYDLFSRKDGKLVIASSQDGGSGIHIFDTRSNGWKDAYSSIEPIGKISDIVNYRKEVLKNLKSFKKPSYQREPIQVIGFEGGGEKLAQKYSHNKKALNLYNSGWLAGKCEIRSWRSPLYDNCPYGQRRDRRNDYDYTKEQLLEIFKSKLEGADGMAPWGGHGTDPLYYSLDLLKSVADYTHSEGKKVIYVYPEMNGHDESFQFLLENHFYPLAEHLQKLGSKIAIRAKGLYYTINIYSKAWKRYISGEFADVFIANMEETTDKCQDVSLASRMGLWLAGSIDGWGARCSRDDPSFDRSRQFSSQKLANHVMRKTLYSLACGASSVHNHIVNNEDMNLYYDLIEKEALFIPKRNELLSLSPVHLSIYEPSPAMTSGEVGSKWGVYFNREKEEASPRVISRIYSSWLGSSVTPWDYSAIASYVVDRRQNPIPSFPYGMVVITPVQEGALADNKAPRGKMVDKLHPIYKNILKEYITNGEDYISADGKEHFKADTYYKEVQKAIVEGGKKLPITVTSQEGGQIGWVVAQVAPDHLRLTLVDGGYLNPSLQNAVVKFNTVEPLEITDILDGKKFKCKKGESIIDVPCGMFRFIDIKLSKNL